MSAQIKSVCCPPFEPEPWDDTVIEWENKPFVKDTVMCLFHVPMNFGAVMKRNRTKFETAGIQPGDMVLSDAQSPWKATVYLEADQEVPDAEMTELSGRYLSKVYEGPYRDAGKWMKAIRQRAKERGEDPKTVYFYYTTCPKCAKKYGKNYVVLLAEL